MIQEMLKNSGNGSGSGSIKYEEVTFSNIVNGGPGNIVTFTNTLNFIPKNIYGIKIINSTWSSGSGTCAVSNFSVDGQSLTVSVVKNSNYNTSSITYGIYYD